MSRRVGLRTMQSVGGKVPVPPPPENPILVGAGSTHYLWQRKVCRTSDGTIHILVPRDGKITHYYSYDNGNTWNSQDVWTIQQDCAIDKDSNDNLVATKCSGDWQPCHFKKAIVTKGTSWTWSWGTQKTVDATTGLWRPDIVVDNNDYYHVVYARWQGPFTRYVRWARCTDGTGDSWTITDIVDEWFKGYVYAGVVKDSQNNLYIFGNRLKGYLRVVKINYEGGTSWSIDGYWHDSTKIGYPGSYHVLPDDRIIVSYSGANGYDKCLWFRKSTNPRDISAWNGMVWLLSPGELDSVYFLSLMVIDSNTIRVYYCRGTNLCYKESTDGGATFGAEQTVYNIGTNTYPNISKTTVDGIIDFVWTNNGNVMWFWASE